jgi:predicted transcriptional regulator
MSASSLIPAKATRPQEQSDAIVVSFRADWYAHIQNNDFTVVIRKQIPKMRPFQWLYFHLNKPISGICARAPILQTFRATSNEVLGLAAEIKLTAAEIKNYLWKDATVGCYRLGTIESFRRPLPIKEIANFLKYQPPQNFVILSKQAKELIDIMAGVVS